MEVINATGRRKTAVARVYLTKGKGNVTVNKKDYKVFFPTTVLQGKIQQAFVATDTKDTFDVKVNVFGGGITGQAEAVRHAISRALVKSDETNRALLKVDSLLTRDPRMVE
ncbi:MAG: 30S ribosomal protein S9, partial [Flavobacteriales bacterium CG_4_10_14_0_8_um_filter_32_5]